MIDSLLPTPEMPPMPVRRVARADEKPVRDFRASVEEQHADGPSPPPTDAVAGEAEARVDRQVDGTGQSLLLPWQLVANNALSHVFLQGVPAAGSGYADIGPATTVSRLHTASTLAETAVGAVCVRADGAAATPLHVTATGAPRAPGTVGADAALERSEASAVLASLAERWQERLLRWSSHGAHGVSVRVRDYRLDAAGEQALAQGLLAFASDRGLALQRIVINARELWHAGTPSPPQSGDTHGR